jgi:hypothetical protein
VGNQEGFYTGFGIPFHSLKTHGEDEDDDEDEKEEEEKG